MPRLSNFEKTKNQALDLLKTIKLDKKERNRYETSIISAQRIDKVQRIIDELNAVSTGINTQVFRQEQQASVIEKRLNKIRESRRRPIFIKQTLLDQIRFFTKYAFEYSNVYDNRSFYEAIKDAIERFPSATSVSIHFTNKQSGNKVRSISLTVSDLFSFEMFEEALNKIIQGNFVGSDAVNLNTDEIVYTNFNLSSTRIAGGSSSDKMLFEVEGIEQTKTKLNNKTIGLNDCAKQCLLKLVNKDSECYKELVKIQPKNLSMFDDLTNFIKKWLLNINIICNSFALKKPHNEIIKNGEVIKFVIEDSKRKGLMRNHIATKLILNQDIEVVELYSYLNGSTNEDGFVEYFFSGNGVSIGTIIYDEFNQHYDIIKNNELKLCDDVYITAECKIIKNNQILFSPKQANLNNKIKEEVKHQYLFFDYETVIDFSKNSCMQEYSLSILNLNNRDLIDLTKADEKKDEKTVNEIKEKNCVTFLGFDCSIQFIKWLLEYQKDTSFVLIGYNNANFDNFILLDALLKYNEIDTEYNVSDIFYNGSQLLNFYINGRHNTFDIHKHLMGRLSDNCTSFKINCCAKKSFDHSKAQQMYLDGTLIDYINEDLELKNYNEYDVLATAVLFNKYRNALKQIPATKNYANSLHEIKTIGSLIYKVFDESKNKKQFNLPKLNYQQYKDLQSSKIAGRVELFNGIQKVNERLVSTDVCSLYPYVMSVAPNYYPCGEIIQTNEYKGDDVIGFYYCDIDQTNLKPNNLPNIYAKKSKIDNDWSYQGILENYLISNVMIGLLKKFNCKVVIRNGFYFSDKKKSCDMFDFLLDFMNAKNNQDTMKKNKNNDYNSALRETLKLLMNSISGKVIEGLHNEKTTDVGSVAEYEKIKNKAQSINFINAIGNKIFVTYEIDEEKLINKQRPIYLGVLIYDYAKRYMYENSYSKIGLDQLLYTDTDASKFRYNQFILWKKWIDENNIQVPHWKEVELIDERYKNHKIYDSNSKVFGSFEDELETMTGNNYVFYCLEKKSWCYSVDGNSKMRFKGLNDSAILLTLDENFITSKTIKHSDSTNEKKYLFKKNSELEVYNYAINNKHLSLDGNEVKFFEQVYSTGEAYLLCSSFRKIVKNSAHNVQLGQENKYNNLMNKIQVNYIMKHIKLNL